MNKSEVIHLRIESEIMEEIRKHSKQNYRTINQTINLLLKQSTQQGGGNK
jgi:hypothetical protein